MIRGEGVPPGNTVAIPFGGKFSSGAENLASVLDAMSESVIFIDPEGVIFAANRAAWEHLGFTEGESLLGKNLFDSVPGGNGTLRRIRVAQVLGTGNPVQFEEILFGRRFVNAIFPVKAADGSARGLALFAMETIKGKNTDIHKLDSESFIRSVVKDLPVGIAVFPPEPGKGSVYITRPETLDSAGIFWEVVAGDLYPGENSFPEQKTAPEEGVSLRFSVIGQKKGPSDTTFCPAGFYSFPVYPADPETIMIDRLDREGKYLVVNRQVCKMFGPSARSCRASKGMPFVFSSPGK